VTPKHLLSTIGTMNVERRYYACRACTAVQLELSESRFYFSHKPLSGNGRDSSVAPRERAARNGAMERGEFVFFDRTVGWN